MNSLHAALKDLRDIRDALADLQAQERCPQCRGMIAHSVDCALMIALTKANALIAEVERASIIRDAINGDLKSQG